MKIKLWFFGKQNEISDFEREMAKRIGFRCDFEFSSLTPSGVNNPLVAKKKEADISLKSQWI